MSEALRLLLFIFTAPLAGLREVRDRAPVLPAFGLAWGANLLYLLYTQWQYWIVGTGHASAWGVVRRALMFTVPLLLLAFVFAPLLAFLVNLLDKREGVRAVLRQDYTALISCLFYAWAACCLWAMPLALLEQLTGMRENVMAEWQKAVAEQKVAFSSNITPAMLPRLVSLSMALVTVFPFFTAWAWLVVRQVFRIPGLMAAALVGASFLLGYLLLLPTLPILLVASGSPFLLLLLFILLRGYFYTLARESQSQNEFRRNLESATLNPADASAHYNLGLVHLRRNQLDEAQQRFTRAVEVDPEEVDAYYQMGRIARAQGRWADAVRYFEEVVRRDEAHAQHEIWREIGATYLGAQQHADARAMLERFLEQRTSDPQGLYLLGRALAGVGEKDAARAALNACIQAVDTSPNYKYQAEKRWRTEAQQFLRSLA